MTIDPAVGQGPRFGDRSYGEGNDGGRNIRQSFDVGVNRRGFSQGIVAASAGLTAASWTSLIRGARPNETLRVGVIGTGVRGKYLTGNLPESARVTAICDCAESQMEGTLNPKPAFRPVLERFLETAARHCVRYQDYRRMINREKLDAVIIATPDHHHAPAAIRALRAGLDVYLEKPLTVCIGEGRQLADTVQQTGQILQVGSQQRTMERNRFACEFIRDGGLGRISKVELPNYPGPIRHPVYPAEPVPEGLDWNLFIGSTPMRPHNRKLWVKDDFKVGDLMWRGWDLFRDYSGHIMTNWGAHSIDMMQYALGQDDTGPVRVKAVKPNSVQEIYQDWAHKTPAPGIPPSGDGSYERKRKPDSSDGSHARQSVDERRFWPVRMWYADGVEVHFSGKNSAARFFGELGTMKIRRNHFEVDPPELVRNGPDQAIAEKWKGTGHVARPHLQNWLDCIRTRNQPNAPVEVGHRTVTICHLANIARELGRELHWNPDEERFNNDSVADALLTRPGRNGFHI